MKIPFYEPQDYKNFLSWRQRTYQLVRRVVIYYRHAWMCRGYSIYPLPELYIIADPTLALMKRTYNAQDGKRNPFEPDMVSKFKFRGYEPWERS